MNVGKFGRLAQLVRALRLHRRGPGFESLNAHHSIRINGLKFSDLDVLGLCRFLGAVALLWNRSALASAGDPRGRACSGGRWDSGPSSVLDSGDRVGSVVYFVDSWFRSSWNSFHALDPVLPGNIHEKIRPGSEE
jgi:hypothetical protein